MQTDIAIEQIPAIVADARVQAEAAAEQYVRDKLGGHDWMPCGFAWVSVYGVRSNSRLGKALIAQGFRKPYGSKSLQLWNPCGLPLQNADAKLLGAQAAAKVLRAAGLDASADSCLD